MEEPVIILFKTLYELIKIWRHDSVCRNFILLQFETLDCLK